VQVIKASILTATSCVKRSAPTGTDIPHATYNDIAFELLGDREGRLSDSQRLKITLF
jgi:hypothetical protein